MSLLIKIRLNIPNCFSEVFLSHFLLLYVYVRVLHNLSDFGDVLNMPMFIHFYLSKFSSLYDQYKELYSVHALVHLWQQVQQHGSLAFHR